MTRFSKNTWKPFVLGMLLGSVGLGQYITACCGTVESTRDPDVVVVDKSEIRETEIPGEYIVTEGWLLERISSEQGLLSALDACEEERDRLREHSLHMDPGFSTDDLANGHLADSVLISDLLLRETSGVEGSEFSDGLVIKDRSGVPGTPQTSPRVSAFFPHVSHVVRASTDPQVIRVDAVTHVASVENAQPVRNRPFKDLVGHSVRRSDFSASQPVTGDKLSVSGLASGSNPKPTGAGFGNVGHKSIFEKLRVHVLSVIVRGDPEYRVDRQRARFDVKPRRLRDKAKQSGVTNGAQ